MEIRKPCCIKINVHKLWTVWEIFMVKLILWMWKPDFIFLSFFKLKIEKNKGKYLLISYESCVTQSIRMPCVSFDINTNCFLFAKRNNREHQIWQNYVQIISVSIIILNLY